MILFDNQTEGYSHVKCSLASSPNLFPSGLILIVARFKGRTLLHMESSPYRLFIM